MEEQPQLRPQRRGSAALLGLLIGAAPTAEAPVGLPGNASATADAGAGLPATPVADHARFDGRSSRPGIALMLPDATPPFSATGRPGPSGNVADGGDWPQGAEPGQQGSGAVAKHQAGGSVLPARPLLGSARSEATLPETPAGAHSSTPGRDAAPLRVDGANIVPPDAPPLPGLATAAEPAPAAGTPAVSAARIDPPAAVVRSASTNEAKSDPTDVAGHGAADVAGTDHTDVAGNGAADAAGPDPAAAAANPLLAALAELAGGGAGWEGKTWVAVGRATTEIQISANLPANATMMQAMEIEVMLYDAHRQLHSLQLEVQKLEPDHWQVTFIAADAAGGPASGTLDLGFGPTSGEMSGLLATLATPSGIVFDIAPAPDTAREAPSFRRAVTCLGSRNEGAWTSSCGSIWTSIQGSPRGAATAAGERGHRRGLARGRCQCRHTGAVASRGAGGTGGADQHPALDAGGAAGGGDRLGGAGRGCPQRLVPRAGALPG